MRDEFADLGLGNLTYLELDGLDHHFNDADGVNKMADLQATFYAWMGESAFL